VSVTIREYASSDDLRPCVPVMRILRGHLDPDDVAAAARLRRQMTQGPGATALAELAPDGGVSVVGHVRQRSAY